MAQYGDYVYTESGGNATITEYIGTGTAIIIPDELETYPTIAIGASAFISKDTLTSVIIPDTITSIGSNAFQSCINITSITIGAGVSSIGEWAFSSCLALTSIIIPENVTTISTAAFESCISLESVNIPIAITHIPDYAFWRCTSLISIVIPANVTNIGVQAFYECTSLTSISFPGLVAPTSVSSDWITNASAELLGHAYLASNFPSPDDTWNELTMGDVIPATEEYTYTVAYALATTSGYTGAGGSILVPSSLGGYPVTSIGSYTFASNTTLTAVTIPLCITSIGEWAFSSCTNLTSIVIPDGVTSIGDAAFYSCTLVTSVSMGTKVESIGTYAFRACSLLSLITFRGLIAPTVVGANWLLNTSASIKGKAYYGSNFPVPGESFHGLLMDVRIPEDYTYTITNGLATITGYVGLGGNITTPDTLAEQPVVAIGNQGFLSAVSITGITISAGITSIGDRAFEQCISIITVNIPNTITSIGSAPFLGCSILTAITVDVSSASFTAVDGVLYNRDLTTLIQYPNGLAGTFTIPDGVETISIGAFQQSYLITDVVIPEGVTYIGQMAFQYCTALATVNIPSTVTFIGWQAFAACTSLSEIIIPDTLESLGESAFIQCNSLTTITIPDSMTLIGDGVFAGCDSLTEIIVGADNPNYSSLDGVLYNKLRSTIIQYPAGKSGGFTIPNSVTVIDNHAFYDCKLLTYVILSVRTTSIGRASFYGCILLTSVIVTGRVTTIDNDAFYGCIALTSATIGSRVSSIGDGIFQSCTSLLSITFLGLDAPTYVGINWVLDTPIEVLGHAYPDSDFPAPDEVWNDLTMGIVIGPTVPGVPMELTATPDNAEIVLDWAAPLSNGGKTITAYNIYRSTTGTYSLIGTTLGTVLTFTNNGLTNGDTYYYKVSAVNIIGEGADSDEVSEIPYTVPDAPTGLMLYPGDMQMSMSWDAPAFDGGRAVTYYIIYQDNVPLSTHVTELTTIITELINGQEYEFDVRAYNLAGGGDRSTSELGTPNSMKTMCYQGDVDETLCDNINIDTNEIVALSSVGCSVGNIDVVYVWATGSTLSSPASGTIEVNYTGMTGNMAAPVNMGKATMILSGTGSPFMTYIELTNFKHSYLGITSVTNKLGMAISDLEIHCAGKSGIN